MNPQTIWESTLDDRYEVQLAPYMDELKIRDAGEEIFSQQVGLSH